MLCMCSLVHTRHTNIKPSPYRNLVLKVFFYGSIINHTAKCVSAQISSFLNKIILTLTLNIFKRLKFFLPSHILNQASSRLIPQNILAVSYLMLKLHFQSKMDLNPLIFHRLHENLQLQPSFT